MAAPRLAAAAEDTMEEVAEADTQDKVAEAITMLSRAMAMARRARISTASRAIMGVLLRTTHHLRPMEAQPSNPSHSNSGPMSR